MHNSSRFGPTSTFNLITHVRLPADRLRCRLRPLTVCFGLHCHETSPEVSRSSAENRITPAQCRADKRN
jgi:hypothetical protein